jgi:diguanylate cyclase (GGDEF)-like protein
VDRFKRINDTHGHAFGDFVLREVAGLAVRLIRKEDAVIRYGGDEFVVLLVQAGRYGARQFAERLLTRIREHRFDDGTHRADITINIGLATFPEDAGADPAEGLPGEADGRPRDRQNLDPLCARLADDLLQKADARLYAAKGKGLHGVMAE